MGYTEWEWKVFLNQAEVEMVKGGDLIVEGTSLRSEAAVDTTDSEYAQESGREFDDAMSTRGIKFGSRAMTQGIGEIKKSS